MRLHIHIYIISEMTVIEKMLLILYFLEWGGVLR